MFWNDHYLNLKGTLKINIWRLSSGTNDCVNLTKDLIEFKFNSLDMLNSTEFDFA